MKVWAKVLISVEKNWVFGLLSNDSYLVIFPIDFFNGILALNHVLILIILGLNLFDFLLFNH